MSYNATAFKQQVARGLEVAKRVLHNDRHLLPADQVAHQYQDKYVLAETLTSTTIQSALSVLRELGIDAATLQDLKSWSQDRSVSLRLQSEEKCVFVKKTSREQERATRHETEYSIGIKVTDKVVDTIEEWFWTFSVEWSVVAFRGSDVEGARTLLSRSGECELMTLTEKTPRPQVSVVPPVSVNITWLLAHAEHFGIAREAPSCHTPRRNEDIQGALDCFSALHTFGSDVAAYFTRRLFPTQPEHGFSLASAFGGKLFVPSLPCFDADADSPQLGLEDVNLFLRQERSALLAQVERISDDLSSGDKLISPLEGKVLLLVNHAQALCVAYQQGIEYIEDMLHQQLVAALGKVVTPADFSEYMRFHNRKVFREAYAPRPFSYHVRRPAHYPEGVVSIEQNGQQEIETIVRHSHATRPMTFPLNASTNVSFLGHRYLHAWVDHRFGQNAHSSLALSARARQFSSFVLLCGTIAGADVFQPQHAVIIKNKDDLRLPLILETMPSAGEFRDAIASLSPEQQRFAKAYRGMQLAGTLFAVVTVQIKPQLEVLLKLPVDGLTKEIQLTEDILELLMTYQIPSDLLRFDELNNPKATDQERVDAVRQNVRAVNQVILGAKKKEVELAKAKALLEEAERRKAEEEARKKKEQEPMLRRQAEERYRAPRRRMASAARPQRATLANASVSLARNSAAPRSSRRAAAPPASVMAREQVAPRKPPATDRAPVPVQPDPVFEDASDTSSPPDDLSLSSSVVAEDAEDYTALPALLDSKFEAMDSDAALRPTTIKVGPSWTLISQESVLDKPKTSTLRKDRHKQLRRDAFDLLDALSRSGTLCIEHASLHVVLAFTHCFTKSLINTLVQDNVNPIEKLERSNLIIATTVQGEESRALLKPSEVENVRQFAPEQLFLEQ